MTPRNFLFILLLVSCGTHKTYDPLIPKDMSVENERNNKLIVFVGEKIEVTELPYKKGDFDSKFHAKYKVLQLVYGKYVKETIEFIAYDHFGTPPFSKYKNVLLFVSEYDEKYYHEKYMFNDVYLTKDGRWAGPYSEDYLHEYNDSTTVKPEIIEFAEEVSYPVKIVYPDGEEQKFAYPAPYYKTVGDKAIAVYGNYIPELFKLKKDGVLTARQLFGNRKEEPMIDKDVEIKE